MIIVNNVNDWMNELADAVRNGDMETIIKLQDISYQWIQPREEAGAQMNLTEACLEALNTY